MGLVTDVDGVALEVTDDISKEIRITRDALGRVLAANEIGVALEMEKGASEVIRAVWYEKR